jgi:diguanylate cyclase (GGDEF)-like protein
LYEFTGTFDSQLAVLTGVTACLAAAGVASTRYRRYVTMRMAGLLQSLAHANDQLDHSALHDSLTNLPGRALFEDRLSQALASLRTETGAVAVVFVGLDRFKLINDCRGHACGDQVLLAVGQRLTASLQPRDTVARIGGDEFALLLTDAGNAADVAAIADRVRRELAAPFLIMGQELRLTASVGASVYPDHGRDGSTLMVCADLALDHAKKIGRDNCALFTPTMNGIVNARAEMERCLRHSLEHGEFTLHYQPKIAIGSGNIVGVEALVRWQHPVLGLVPPNDFIPLAEELGLIVPLGAWVLHEACAQNRAWQVAGLPKLKMGVNLSAAQFRRGNLPETVAAILAQTGLDADCLELELTESMLMHDADGATLVLERLCAMGVWLSIDDFGTGYSSLSYLKRFHLDTLKIDRSFVRDLSVDVDDAAIVRSIIVLAHSLRLNVIAEGVETADQLEFLRTLGCDEFQGYYASRPVPADQFETFLRCGETPCSGSRAFRPVLVEAAAMPVSVSR